VSSSLFSPQNSLIDQWILCARACFDIPIDIEQYLRNSLSHKIPPLFMQWAKNFENDLFEARYGYSSGLPQLEPYTEICIETLLQEKGVLQHCRPLISQHTLCITHDIDHLELSPKLMLKRIISERKMTSFKQNKRSFLPSIRTLLELSASLSTSSKSVATIFAASPIFSKNPFYWPMQWIMDPSYTVNHPQFLEFKALIKEFQCDVGLHGSFYSLSQNFLEREKEVLEVAMGHEINLLRQHWLHLPGRKAWSVIKKSKFQIDSTLGWNGTIGFRGGMARPFEILVDKESQSTIWEVPLLLMDGPLFCDLNFSPKKIEKLTKELLKKVIQRNGCVAINWHDRSADPFYQWDGLFKEILTFSALNNFQFLTLKEAVQVCFEKRFFSAN